MTPERAITDAYKSLRGVGMDDLTALAAYALAQLCDGPNCHASAGQLRRWSQILLEASRMIVEAE